MTSGVYIGVDVGKSWLDVNENGSDDEQRFNNDRNGLRKLVEWLKVRQVELVTFEATGGYESQAATPYWTLRLQ